jgi:tRNA1(Val) A37 N6-methylase TrmN6
MERYRIDDLQINGLKIKQDTTLFCFGTDAVLLSSFAAKHICAAHRVIDLGCGNGIIPLLLSAKTDCNSIAGLEISSRSVQLARQNVTFNALEGRIDIIEGDIRQTAAQFVPESYDIVVTNPPYIKQADGKINEDMDIAVARHEILCSLNDVLAAAKRLLRFRGDFFMIHRTHRLSEIIGLMRENRIEPKTLCFIHANKNEKSNLVLIHGIKGGGCWLDVLPPICIYDKNGGYTEQIYQIYHETV